ncbi:response regulator [Planctomicrobium piriforme]|uniref:histidine kinase n=1 Tax=Planctomicrobium piriforme TaxID=1576369 RepID=A0A1I3RC35_9PLAN|nr:response regulator [Planctomicrobium piriforme]SFJ42756.1 PAS domain S-box-containing protein [Planctomicrobium piriforme]
MNDESKSSVDELARSNSDLQNLMVATDIATVFVDRELRIQRLTTSAKALFNVISTDLGRPLSDFSCQLEYPEIVADAERSLTHLQSEQREVRAGERWYIARTLPYRTADDQIAGVVLTFLDITQQKASEEKILRIAADSERQRRVYETVLTNTPDFVYVFSLDYRVLYANEALIKMWGRGHDGAIGKTFLEIGYEPWHAEMHEREIDQVRATRQPIRGEVPFTGTHGKRQYDYIFVPVIGADGEVEAVAGTTRDVTERKETERQLREGQEQLDFALAAADLGYWSLNLADHTARRTLRHDQLFGYDALLPEWTYEMFLDHVVPEDRAMVDAAFQKSVATGSAWAVECRIQRADGAVRHIWKKGLALRNAQGQVERMLSIVGDITDRRQAEERQAFLGRFADTLRRLSDPVEVQAVASRVLGEYLGANRVVYFEIRGDDYVIERDYTAGVRPLAGRYPVAAFGQDLLAVLLDGRTVIEADATTEPYRPASERAAFANIQVRGHVDVPLVKGGRFVAGMTVQVSDRRDWTPQDVGLIEETAERTWAAVERVRAEREVARLAAEADRERRLFAAVLSNTPDFIYTFDLDGRFVYVNTALLALWGKTLEQAVGRNFFELDYPPALADRLQRQIQEVIDTKQPLRDETPYTSGMGERMYEYILAPVVGAGGVVEAVAGSTRDITARKQAEAEREGLVKQLREQDRKKDEFLATLAHELRNPLAPIRNGLQVIRLAGATGMVEQARTMMERQLAQMVRLVDDLLDVSRVTTGKLTLRTAPVDLREVIDAALETSRQMVEQAGHNLAVIVPAEPVFVEGDVTRLAQVISNLLTNSAKYTHQGGQISLALKREDDTAVISVKDDGVGIPPALLDKVFEMFTQVDRTLEKTTGGLGIGLALVKGVVEMHGGTIVAKSEGEGRGSEFVVRLPVLLSAVQNVTSEAADEPVVASSHRRILVADDNLDSAASLGKLLELLGNYVQTANDGLQAVDLAESFRPDVILLDIGMPKLNGYEAARRIRAQAWGQATMLVALTGWGQEEDRKKSADAGFDHHLVKPVELAALEKILAAPAALTPSTDRSNPAAASLRVLVVDDMRDATHILRTLLKAAGHVVRTAFDGPNGLAAALEFRPEVAILDISLPGMSGLELAKRIREQATLHDIVLIAMTGYGDEADRQRSFDAGFNHHLVKPADISVVLKILATVSARLR